MNKKAFTLAETLIVLVILGVVAAITIPAVVRNQIEAQNRTRIKKAMTAYDTAINKFIVENNLKSDVAVYQIAQKNNCTLTSQYFKAVESIEENGNKNLCKFKSADGVWWDISNILNPIIGLKKDDLTDVNSNTRFNLLSRFDKNGSLRVDDLAYEQNNPNATSEEVKQLTAIWNFVNNIKEEPFYYNWDEEYANISQYLKTECKKNKKTQCYERIDFDNNGFDCTSIEDGCAENGIDIFIYDSQGNNIGYYETMFYGTKNFDTFDASKLSAEDIVITDIPVYNPKGERIPLAPDKKSCSSRTAEFNCKTYKNWDNCECDLDDAEDPESEICYCYDN